MTKENRFYKSKNKKMSNDDVLIEKKTNVIILNAIEALIDLKGDIETFKKDFHSAYKVINEDRLPSDAIPLMQHLFRALEEDPANINIFLNSPMVKYLATPIYKGHTNLVGEGKDENEWENYEKNPESRTRIKGMTIYSKALKCYYANTDPKTGEKIPAKEDTPIGLDFIEILSTLVKTDSRGEFLRLEKNVDRETQQELLDAASLQIKNFKSKPLFSRNFIRKPTAEREDDEDEYEDE